MYEAPAPRRHRRGLLAVAALLLLGIVLLALGWHRHHRQSAATPSSTAPPPAAAQAAAPPTDMPAAVTPPPDVTLAPFDGMQLPVSRTAGPLHADGPLVQGFAATARGAAFAALHLSLRATPDAGPDVYRPTIQQHVAGDAAAYLATVERDYSAAAARAGVLPGQPVQPSTAVAAGWRVDGLNTSQPTTVHLLLGSTGSPLLVDVPVSLLLDGGDWRLLPPPTGRFAGSPVAGPAGYTPFTP